MGGGEGEVIPIKTTVWNLNGRLLQINFLIPDNEIGVEEILYSLEII